MLTRLTNRGLLAVSFDPPGHGRRSDGRDPLELGREVLASLPPAHVAPGGTHCTRVAPGARLG